MKKSRNLPSVMYNYGLLLILLDLFLDVFGNVSQMDVAKHLQLGKEYVSMKQYHTALTHYHAACDGDPNNYLTHYNRATVYLALNKVKQALTDFDKVLELKPAFVGAKLQRAEILLKLAELNRAEEDFRSLLHENPSDERIASELEKISSLRDISHRLDTLIKENDHEGIEELSTQFIQVCPWATHIRETRAQSYIALGKHMMAIVDMEFNTKLLSDDRQGFFKMANMHFELGYVPEALVQIRNCLKLDPDNKEYHALHKHIKFVNKHLETIKQAQEKEDYLKWRENVEKLLNQTSLPKNVQYIGLQSKCKCLIKSGEGHEAIEVCQKALKIQRDCDTFCDLAEAYLSVDQYDDAIRTYNEALELDSDSHRAKEGKKTAQQRQKMSEKRDYYKILGVSRTATKSQIVTAFRKLARKWHPDHYQDPNEKKKAEKKFIDITNAKEVLMDEEKRERFDKGEDPLDPEARKQSSGFNPFQNFHSFHDSPFQFKFHFH